MTKDKELEALRERVKGLEQERNVQMLRALNATARAETAERERDMLGEVIEDTARELGCENDNEAILFAIDKLRRERDEVREALKPFAALARWLPAKIPEEEVLYRASTIVITAGDLRRAAAIVERGKQ